MLQAVIFKCIYMVVSIVATIFNSFLFASDYVDE